MNLPVLSEADERPGFPEPHLSYSRIAKYLHCPEQYRLYYVERLRPRFPSASLVFGQVLHTALGYLVTGKGDPIGAFWSGWEAAKAANLTYGARDSWDKLLAAGTKLLERFREEELPKLSRVEVVEQAFTIDVTSLALPFVGIIDLVAHVNGQRTLVDFKTSASRYDGHEIALADQLTAYQLAEPDAVQTALCVLVKSKDPVIEWHVGRRTGKHLVEYLDKAVHVSRGILAGEFYKRPGMWCAWCDYLPVCTGDAEQARKTLTQLA